MGTWLASRAGHDPSCRVSACYWGFRRLRAGRRPGQELREDFSAGGDAPNGRARRGRLRAAMVASLVAGIPAADGRSATRAPAIGEVLRSAAPSRAHLPALRSALWKRDMGGLKNHPNSPGESDCLESTSALSAARDEQKALRDRPSDTPGEFGRFLSRPMSRIQRAGRSARMSARGGGGAKNFSMAGLESRSSRPRLDASDERASMAARRRPRRARPLGASPPAEKSSRSSCPPAVVRPKPAEPSIAN